MFITILPCKAPVEPSCNDGLAVFLGRPVVEQLLACIPPLLVLIRNLFVFHFIATAEMYILQTLNLPRERQKTYIESKSLA